jgi:hypothetical protein
MLRFPSLAFLFYSLSYDAVSVFLAYMDNIYNMHKIKGSLLCRTNTPVECDGFEVAAFMNRVERKKHKN